jgi:DNA repair protein RadC
MRTFHGMGTAQRTMTAIPPPQRPRERLLQLGSDSLADAELVAVLLGTGGRGRNALDLAHDLLIDYGGPGGLAGISPEELSRRQGVGPAKAARLVAAFSLARRIGPPARGVQLRDSGDIATVARLWLADARRERAVVIVCDTALRVRRAFVITEGASDRCLLPVREILTAVLLHDGAAFAVAHNHPSGEVEPSAADEEVTAVLLEAAEVVGLDFLGHVVVSRERWASCSARAP